MRDVGDSEPTWISWEEASRLTGFPVSTIDYATRVGRIARRPARGVLPSLDRESVLAWAQWQRDLVAQRQARQRERQDATAAKQRLAAASRPEDLLLGPPTGGPWMSLPAAAKRLDVGVATIRRWLDDERLDGAQRSERWVSEASVERLAVERRTDAAAWVSLKRAQKIVGCSDRVLALLADEGLIVQRPGHRGQASISRESAEAAALVLAHRRDQANAKRMEREALRDRSSPPDNGTVWLSVSTTALLLGLSESGTTLRIRSGRLPATRRGRRWWVRREDAEQAAAAKAFARRHTDQ